MEHLCYGSEVGSLKKKKHHLYVDNDTMMMERNQQLHDEVYAVPPETRGDLHFKTPLLTSTSTLR